MIRHFKPICLILASAILGPAATVTQLALCGNSDRDRNSSTVQGTSSCRNSANGAFSSASSSYEVNIIGNQLSVLLSADILAGGAEIGSSGGALSRIDLSLQVGSLAGPVQSAFVAGLASTGQTNNGASSSTNINFVPAFPPTYPRNLGPVLVQLGGNPFTIYASAQSAGGASYSQEVAGGGPGVFIALRFFERDGVTPINLAEVPEPGTVVLAGVGLAIAGAFSFLQKRC